MPNPVKQLPPFSPEEIEERTEIAATLAGDPARELIDLEDDLPPWPPRYLRLEDHAAGLLIITERARVLVPADRADDFNAIIRAMIDTRLLPLGWAAGNC